MANEELLWTEFLPATKHHYNTECNSVMLLEWAPQINNFFFLFIEGEFVRKRWNHMNNKLKIFKSRMTEINKEMETWWTKFESVIPYFDKTSVLLKKCLQVMHLQKECRDKITERKPCKKNPLHAYANKMWQTKSCCEPNFSPLQNITITPNVTV